MMRTLLNKKKKKKKKPNAMYIALAHVGCTRLALGLQGLASGAQGLALVFRCQHVGLDHSEAPTFTFCTVEYRLKFILCIICLNPSNSAEDRAVLQNLTQITLVYP